jgi:hypothetical protein
LVVPNFFHWRTMEVTVFLGAFNTAGMFWYPFPRTVPRHNPVSELYGENLWPHGMVFALTFTVNYGTLYRCVCLSESCPINWIYHRLTQSCRNISRMINRNRMHLT